jgi:hypothetical protein
MKSKLRKKKNTGDEPNPTVIHISMDVSQGNFPCSDLN